MPKQNLLFALLLCCAVSVFGQQRYTISGYVYDGESSEAMIGATVLDMKSGLGAVTNNFGFFSLTLPTDSVRLIASYVGYSKLDTSFLLKTDAVIDFKLPESVELAAVEVNAVRSERIEEKVQMSQITVPIEQIKHIPALMGEVDVLKVLQLLPGVQGGGEGQSGLYVRGGSPDQNLILLDGVPVYNVSHLLGFFSVFNADALKSVTLTKGGYPARYGGRLSSVLEINMKEGNMREWHGVVSVGAISSRATIEGPLVKDKVSFLFSARRTYLDVVAAPFIALAGRSEGADDIKLKLYFYDLNSKINWKINDKHRVYLSGYFGRDVFGFGVKEKSSSYVNNIENQTDWGNETFAARWNWMLSNKLFSNVTLTRSRYTFNLLAKVEDGQLPDDVTSFGALYRSGIVDNGVRWDLDYALSPKHYIKVGAGVTQHSYNPGALQLELDFGEEQGLDTTLGPGNRRSTESFIFVEDEFTFGALKGNIGVHASSLNTDGVFYPSVQPRLGLNYLVAKNWAVKASYATMAQFVNLLTNEALSLPTDLWVPSTSKIKPQRSWQAAVGAARTIGEEYEFSVEGFYKDMRNVLSYKEGATFLGLDNDWESRVTQGRGWVYGAEVFLQKKTGRTTGWVGYTWSKNFRQFDEINGGIKYPFKYDRRHDFKAVATYRITPKCIVSATWIYGTGNAITLTNYRYQIPNISLTGFYNSNYVSPISIPGQRNAQRMAAYHRADIAFEFLKKKKRWERKWVLSAYNIYARANPYFVYQTERLKNGKVETQFRQIALFPLVPSVSYEIKF